MLKCFSNEETKSHVAESMKFISDAKLIKICENEVNKA